MHLSIGLASERDKPKVGKTSACLYPGAIQVSPWRPRPILSIPSHERNVLCPLLEMARRPGAAFIATPLFKSWHQVCGLTFPRQCITTSPSGRRKRALPSPYLLSVGRFTACSLPWHYTTPSNNRYRQCPPSTPLERGHDQATLPQLNSVFFTTGLDCCHKVPRKVPQS